MSPDALLPVRAQLDLRVSMRDGVALSVDLFLPDAPGGAPPAWPTILQRTPYDNARRQTPRFYWVEVARYFASRGYAFVSQDVRGRGDSDGAWHPFMNEAEDGYDTVEWIAQQPWSNGRVGMMGGSYGGLVQWLTAREGPPHLTTLVSTAAAGRLMEELPYRHGKLRPPWAMWWLNMVAGRTVQPPELIDWPRVIRARPAKDVDLAAGRRNTVWRTWLAHPTLDDYWRQMGMLGRFARIDLPVLHITGWFDGDQLGQLYYWRQMAAHSPARDRQFLLSGPWDHAGTRSPEPRHGELEFGDAAALDMNAIHLRWFDYWLRGHGAAPTDFAPGCRSRIFLMGDNRWRDDPTWPPPSAAAERWYLRSGGRANTAAGDGRLEPAAPPEGEPPDRYTYDPDAPTPSSETPEGFPPSEVRLDQRWLLGREDVLVYTSAPLAHPLEVTGHSFVVVEAATDAPDTDFAATLYDVFPDGRSMALCDGIVRASYRNDSGRPETAPLDPGRPYTYRIELVAISNVFLPGHHVRVAVMSARWPAYDRNPNTGAPPGDDAVARPAAQVVLHDRDHASHLLIPVVPRGAA